MNQHPNYVRGLTLLSIIKHENRPLTKDEYKEVKAMEWYYQKQFWEAHITEAGHEEYRKMPSKGKHGKYDGYVELWNLYNSPLMKALV